MMKIFRFDSWPGLIERFLAKHALRNKPFDWPAIGSEEWVEWLNVWSGAFRRNRVTPTEANEASLRMAEGEAPYFNQQIPTMLKLVESVRTEREAEKLAARMKEQPRGCDCCHGSGWVSVYHPEYRGSRTVIVQSASGEMRKVKGIVSVVCNCQVGDVILGSLKKKDEILASAIMTLSFVRSGKSIYVEQDPTEDTTAATREQIQAVVNRFFGGMLPVKTTPAPAKAVASPAPF